ncbi:MAG: hypothetical protein WCH59_05220 [Chitinophagia bacterium]|jgi:hypothetical protein
MKKVFVLVTAAFLLAGTGVANACDGKKCDKKDCGKKECCKKDGEKKSTPASSKTAKKA